MNRERLVSNAVVKPKGSSKLYIGHEIETCKDFFGIYYRRPFEKVAYTHTAGLPDVLTCIEQGILTDWDTQKAVWDKLFGPEGMDVSPPFPPVSRSLKFVVDSDGNAKLTTRSMSLLVTEPYFNLPGVRETYDEMIFEEWEFQSYLNCPRASIRPILRHHSLKSGYQLLH